MGPFAFVLFPVHISPTTAAAALLSRYLTERAILGFSSHTFIPLSSPWDSFFRAFVSRQLLPISLLPKDGSYHRQSPRSQCCSDIRLQRWTIRWAPGCVNSRPTARGSQEEAEFSQPTAILISHLCTSLYLLFSSLYNVECWLTLLLFLRCELFRIFLFVA